MRTFSRVSLFLVALASGCSRPTALTSPAPTAVTAATTLVTPSVAAAPVTVAEATATPPVDQKKLQAELATLGVSVNNFGEMSAGAESLTADGDFKPGIAAKLAQLERNSVRSFKALDLPTFGAGAGRAVAAIPGLTSVTLWRTKATDAGVAALGSCPTLESLDLNNGSEYPAVGDAGLAGLVKLQNVKEFKCERATITSIGLAAIAGFTKLEVLNLAGCPLDDAAAPLLAKLTYLTQLNVAGSKISGSGLAKVTAGATKLQRLALDRTGLTDADTKALAALPGITNLSLAYTAVTDAGAKELAKSKTLAFVDLSDTKVTDAGVMALAAMPALSSLTAYRLPLTDTSLGALAKAPELGTLWLSGNNFTADGVAKFKKDRPKVTFINN